MTRKLIFTTVVLSSVIMACTANPRKLAVTKKAGGAGGANLEQIELPKVKEIVGSNSNCLQLQPLLNELANQTGQTYTVHMRDSDFLEKENKPWSEKAKDNSDEIATRARILINEEKPPLFEMFNAEHLMSSKMIAPYISVKEQNGCTSLTFADGRTFVIKASGPTPEQQQQKQWQQQQQQANNRKPGQGGTLKPGQGGGMNKPMARRQINPGLTLVDEKKGEIRTYTVIGNRLHIQIYQPAGLVDTCKKEINNTLIHRSEYVLNFTTKQHKVFAVTQRLAELLRATLKNPAALETGKDEGQQGRKRDVAKQRGRGAINGVQVEAEELQDYTRQIIAGQLKQVACK